MKYNIPIYRNLSSSYLKFNNRYLNNHYYVFYNDINSELFLNKRYSRFINNIKFGIDFKRYEKE